MLAVSAFDTKRVLMEQEHISGAIVPPPSVAPAGWKQIGRLTGNDKLKLIFAMKHDQEAKNELEELFWKVSNPKDPLYARYLTQEEIAAIIAPSQENVDRVIEFLSSFDSVTIESLPLTRDYIAAYAPIAVAEQIVGCTFYTFEHHTGFKTARCLNGYTLPADVAEVVDFVSGVSRFPSIRKAIVNPNPDVSLTVTPDVIRNRYNIGSTVGGLSPNNSQAVHQFLGQYYSQTDLEEFFLLFSSVSKGTKPTIIGPDNGAPGLEASLDIEYIMSVGAKIPTVFWSNVEGNPNNDPFLNWMYTINNATNPPLVNSVSYGDDEDAVSRAYAENTNVQFQKAGLRGLSILFAAGDSGVGGSGFGCKQFVPDFPADSPYVTAVGGTQLGLLQLGTERVWSLGGGGFSNYFSRPAYQAEAVNNYLTNSSVNLPTASKWNSTGRGYPDVSSLANDFVIVIDYKPTPGIGGTSCAAPTFSAIVALLNDLRLSKGLASLGFLNPFLYQNPDAFNDITEGSNPGCGTNGFPATTGWDASSGLGSALFDKLSTAALNA